MQQRRRVLVVVRHGRAEGSAATDHARELTSEGRRDATALGDWLGAWLGDWLGEQEIQADYALVSSAERAVQTWAAVADGAGWDVDPDVDASLYAADPDTVLDVIRTVPDETGCLVVVGHNPTMASLAQLLDDGEGDDDAGAEMAGGFPTSAAAVFRVDVPWADLEYAAATLTAYQVGRA